MEHMTSTSLMPAYGVIFAELLFHSTRINAKLIHADFYILVNAMCMCIKQNIILFSCLYSNETLQHMYPCDDK